MQLVQLGALDVEINDFYDDHSSQICQTHIAFENPKGKTNVGKNCAAI